MHTTEPLHYLTQYLKRSVMDRSLSEPDKLMDMRERKKQQVIMSTWKKKIICKSSVELNWNQTHSDSRGFTDTRCTIPECGVSHYSVDFILYQPSRFVSQKRFNGDWNIYETTVIDTNLKIIFKSWQIIEKGRIPTWADHFTNKTNIHAE